MRLPGNSCPALAGELPQCTQSTVQERNAKENFD